MKGQMSVTRSQASEAPSSERLHPRRILALALTTALSTLLVGCSGSGPTDDATKDWKQVAVEGLELRIPPAWSTQRLGVHCVRAGPGVLVSNLDASSFEREAPPDFGGCTTRWNVQGSPRDFVLVDLSRFRYPIAKSIPRNSALPPHLETSPEESRSCECTFEYADLWLDGLSYNIRVWIGERATQSDRESLDAMISSIRWSP